MRVWGITGTNGKTTTTSLIYKIMKDAGRKVSLGGNIGESFAYSIATEKYFWHVLELSSFQLDGCYKFKADIGVLTNITPDHLDRYDYKLETYARSKMRITQNQTASDYFIYSADDDQTNVMLAEMDDTLRAHWKNQFVKSQKMLEWKVLLLRHALRQKKSALVTTLQLMSG